ncbi:MAG: DUF547 domain-containing protein [Luteolibacter sp.]
MKLIITALISCLSSIASVQALDHSHAVFDGVLGKYAKSSGVNYAGLKNDNTSLIAYLDTLAAVSEADFKSYGKEQQMAMLINLYNAATLKLVIDHYPVKSIKDISAPSGGPWKQPVVRLFGKKQTLDYLENDLLRPKYKDPRIHFAINCASIGCPELRNEAFQASKLSAQMDEQTRKFLKDSSKNRLDAKNKTLYLSSIFDWFKGDFVEKSGSVEKFIAPYMSGGDRAIVEKGGLTVKNTDYSWSLNQQ